MQTEDSLSVALKMCSHRVDFIHSIVVFFCSFLAQVEDATDFLLQSS